MRDKVAQNTTNNLTTMSTSASVISTNILQPGLITFTSSVPLSSTIPLLSPAGLSYPNTTTTIGTVDAATYPQMSCLSQTSTVFDQKQSHRSTIDEDNDISFPLSSESSLTTLQLRPIDLTTSSHPEKRKISANSTRTRKLMRSITETGI